MLYDERYTLYVKEVQRRLDAGAHARMQDPHERFLAVLEEVRKERGAPRRAVRTHFHYGEAARAVHEIADPRVAET